EDAVADLADIVPDGLFQAEEGREAVVRVDLDEEDALAARGGDDREGGRERGLARPALAGLDDEPPGEEVIHGELCSPAEAWAAAQPSRAGPSCSSGPRRPACACACACGRCRAWRGTRAGGAA